MVVLKSCFHTHTHIITLIHFTWTCAWDVAFCSPNIETIIRWSKKINLGSILSYYFLKTSVWWISVFIGVHQWCCVSVCLWQIHQFGAESRLCTITLTHFEVSRPPSHSNVCGFLRSASVLWDPAFRPRTVPNTAEQGCLRDTSKKLSQENITP